MKLHHSVVSLALAIALLTPVTVKAQLTTLNVERFGVQEGFTCCAVLTVIQDSYGFLWIGTGNGLYKYDGYTFTHYHPDPDDSLSLSHQWVHALYEDADGDLWVGTQNGLNRFDRATEHFTHYLFDPENAVRFDENYVREIHEHPRGTLWIGTYGGGLIRMEPENGTITRYRHGPEDPSSLPDDYIDALYGDRSGELWIGTEHNGLARLDASSGTFTRYGPDPNGNGVLSGISINAITEIDETPGILWIGSEDRGLNRFDTRTGSIESYRHDVLRAESIQSDNILVLYPDGAGALWVATEGGGLDLFNPVSGRFSATEISPRASPDEDGSVLSIFRDRAGTLWLGTQRGGLLKWDSGRHKFAHTRLPPPSAETVDEVQSIFAEGDSVLWIGTRGRGLFKLDRQAGTQIQYESDQIGSIMRDRAGRLWIGTEGGLNRLDEERGRLVRIRHHPTALSDSTRLRCIIDIEEDRTGKLWLASICRGGLMRYDPETGQISSFRQGEDGFGKNNINGIHVDATGIVWLATDFGGLNRFDPETEQYTTYMEDIYFRSIWSIAEDRAGRLWVGSYGGGLFLFDRKTGERTRFAAKDGLIEDHVSDLVVDDAGHVWVVTQRGVSRFDPEQGTFENFDSSSGIEVGGRVSRGNSGELFFTGRYGFYTLWPDQLPRNPIPPRVALTAFRLFNRTVSYGEDSPLRQHISIAKEIRLNHKQNDFAFDFAALHFSAPERNRYAYMLERYDADWIQVGTQRTATYTNLDPGLYVFHVKAANADGVWADVGTSINVTILPPWWGTWWFRLVVGSLAIGLAVGALQLRVRHHLAIERTRARIADDLHDDIGSGMSSIALMIEATRRNTRLGLAEEHRLADAAQMARQLVGNLRDTVWIIDAGHDTLADLMGRTEQTAGQMLQGTPHTVRVPEVVPAVKLEIELRRNVLMILKEALHNAVRHANASHISVEVGVAGRALKMVVFDDGRGFEAATIEAGRGLRTMRERAASTGGHLFIESSPNGGTTVKFETEIM